MSKTVNERYEELLTADTDMRLHLPRLRNYASSCNHVTELGVRGMVSTWAFLAAKPKTVVSVDLTHPDRCGADVQQTKAAAQSCGTDFKFVQGNDLELELEPTDLLFIDTEHTYGQLQQELALHSGRANRYIILHDTETFGNRGEDGGEGLDRAIHEFLMSGTGNRWRLYEKLPEGNGLSVLVRKE